MSVDEDTLNQISTIGTVILDKITCLLFYDLLQHLLQQNSVFLRLLSHKTNKTSTLELGNFTTNVRRAFHNVRSDVIHCEGSLKVILLLTIGGACREHVH